MIADCHRFPIAYTFPAIPDSLGFPIATDSQRFPIPDCLCEKVHNIQGEFRFYVSLGAKPYDLNSPYHNKR